MIRIVARYRDGRLVKGTTINFSPDAWSFHVQPAGSPYGEGTRVDLRDLKAIFFVRDLEGNRFHQDGHTFETRARFGPSVRVRFQDGEEVTGLANPAYHAPGFFLYPADPHSNNERIFAIRDFVAAIVPVGEGAGDGGDAPAGEVAARAEGPVEPSAEPGPAGGADIPLEPAAG